jgi:hypothetical protein
MAEIITALERVFREKGEGRVEMPPKIGIHTMPDAFLHAMPAAIPGQKAAGMKWVGGYPDNGQRGLPYITGLLILNDSETGVPVALMDCTWITAQRTGAATAVAAKYLARAESESVGILGCGVQGRSNLEALKLLFPLKKVYAYDKDADRAVRYAQEMCGQLGIEVVPVCDPKEAVVRSDMVVTAGRFSACRTRPFNAAGFGRARLRRWWTLIRTGIPAPCMKPISSAPTTCRNFITIATSDIFRTSPPSTRTWESWSPGARRAGSDRKNAPWPVIWASPSRTWRWHR